jgi:ABC-2 type transport system ATP-binding protein
MTTPQPAITASGLRKTYGEQVVLHGIDLDVASGSVLALLGPNGAGKTTVVKILSTLVPADTAIGVTGQFSAVDELLTGRENLRLMADLFHLGRAEGRRRVAELLDRFDLTDSAGKAAATYSGGMRRRLDLAMTLIGDPQVIFLDEPTTGLDPRSRRDVWQLVRGLVSGGTTVLLTTQYLEEADQLADRIAVLDHGRLVAHGTAEELKRRVPGGHVALRFADPAALDRAAGAFGTATRDDAALTLQVPGDGSVRSLRELLGRLDAAGVEVDRLSLHSPDLDDVFLALTGQHRTEQVTV